MDKEILYIKKQYTMFDLSIKSDRIFYWENTISCPDVVLNLINSLDIIDSSNKYIPKWVPWKASNDDSVIYGEVKHINADIVKNLIDENKINNKIRFIINSLLMAQTMCFEEYILKNNLNKNDYFLDCNVLSIKKWFPGSKMGPHSDGGSQFPKLSFTAITYLNDDFDGGEICFPEQKVCIKPSPGSTIIFPSDFKHEVKEVLNKNRYMLSNSINMI